MEKYIDYLKQIITLRLHSHLQKEGNKNIRLPLHIQSTEHNTISRLILDFQLDFDETMVLLLTLIPHIQPQFLSQLLDTLLPNGHDLPEFGGVRGSNHRGILPTGETVQFVLAGDDIEKRFEIQRMFSSDHWFAKEHFLWLEPVRDGEPVMSGRLLLDPEMLEYLTLGTISKPVFSSNFPAEYLETEMDWQDLVLNHATKRQIAEIENWITYNDTFMREWDMKRKIKPGYRALFYGPSGTGKTLAATLLGKHTGKDVFRIDLSKVTSKFVGETEKNLSNLFGKAEHKNWILFFDEADALFGKRTDIRDAHDKYANQEVAYLLQKVETYNGLVILATNQRSNIDEAFMRRFQSIIHFPIPLPEERHRIWSNSVPSQIRMAEDINLEKIASLYELTGASIMNVVQYCAVDVLANDSKPLNLKQLESAIMREYVKEGKVV